MAGGGATPAGSPPALEPSPRRGRAVQPRPPPERPPEPWPRSWASPKKESVHRIQGRIGTAPGHRAGGTAACHGWGGGVGGPSSGAAGHGSGGGAGGAWLRPHRAEPLPPPPAECPHSAATNGGYSRKENGGFFCP
ncbi:protein FAM98B-like [Lagopus muta]|uniref:protein FAM98B-like n=1 Tax=Lagopus muta TaxID=64668 RepID=UPI00209D7BA4|nr:protein FAM98B-like [Lagopus muta]